MNALIWRPFTTLLLCLGGCAQCQSPWDYAGPVQGSPPIPYAQTVTRQGSALNGGPVSTAPTAAANTPNPPAIPAPPKPAAEDPDPIASPPYNRDRTIQR